MQRWLGIFCESFTERRSILSVFFVSIVLTLSACGGGSSSSTEASSGNGNTDNTTATEEQLTKLLVGLTDAEGDFLRYEVDVTAISLSRQSGADVDLLPESTRVDFAQYVEVTELLTMADAPAGVYSSASLTLDFSNADVQVQDAEGNPITASTVDADGNPLTTATVTISFNDRDRFVLRPRVPAQVTLDFDLDASNEVTVEGETATVVVNPVLLADALLEDPKTFRVRGLLESVNVEAEEFSLQVVPFTRRSGRFGEANIHVTEETSFEIDGEELANDLALSALSELPANSAVITNGYWDRDTNEFIAEAVYAGSSVPWGESDALRGTVVARNGNEISVRGATVERSEGQFTFDDTVTVTVSDTTDIVKRGDEAPGLEDISVGSAIFVIGDITAEGLMDASEGLVRIKSSTLSGSVVSTEPLVLDLSLLNGRRLDIYDFAGTGSSEESDADEANYEIFTSTLDLSGINISDPVRVRGTVAEFGAAPEDFEATTIINAAAVRGHMVVSYPDGSATAIANLDEFGVQLNLDGSERHELVRAGIRTDLTSLESTPLVGPGGERGIYVITQDMSAEVYTYYDDFVTALSEDLAGGALVSRFDAQGYYDSLANEFETKRLRVRLVTEQ